MSTFITILLVAIPLTLGVLTIRVNEQLREMKKHDTPDKVEMLSFDLSERQNHSVS